MTFFYWLGVFDLLVCLTAVVGLWDMLKRRRRRMAQQLYMPPEMHEAYARAISQAVAEQMRGRQVNVVSAQINSIELLKSWLSPEQLHDFITWNRFICIGSSTRRQYTVHYGCSGNVSRDDNMRLCFGPKGVGLPLGDVMLAQKIMIENDEDEVLRVANTNMGGGYVDVERVPFCGR